MLLFLKKLELWTKVFGFLSKKLEHRWQHWFLNLFRNFLTIFLWQNWSPNKSRTIPDISLAFPGVYSDSVVKTEVYVPIRKLCGMKIFPKFIQFLKCFKIRSEYVTKCLRKVWGKAVKIDFNVSKRLRLANFSFWKFFLSDFKQNFFWNALKSFSWQKCFLSVCKIFLMTQFFDMKLNWNFSRSFTRNLLIFFQTFSSMIFKIAFYVSRKSIWGWSFLYFFVLYICSLFEQTFKFFVQKIWTLLSMLHS